MMAHAIIPHHNHDEETVTQHNDKNHHDDDNGLDNLFSHFQHLSVDNQFASIQQLISVKQVNILQTDFAFSNFYIFFVIASGETLPTLFPDHPNIYTAFGSSAFSLRGPPFFTV